MLRKLIVVPGWCVGSCLPLSLAFIMGVTSFDNELWVIVRRGKIVTAVRVSELEIEDVNVLAGWYNVEFGKPFPFHKVGESC